MYIFICIYLSFSMYLYICLSIVLSISLSLYIYLFIYKLKKSLTSERGESKKKIICSPRNSTEEEKKFAKRVFDIV